MHIEPGILKTLVRLEACDGGHGTGVLVDRSHVLTCAHVVDRIYSSVSYSTNGSPGNRYVANDALRLRVGDFIAEAVLFDGVRRSGCLADVHPHDDFALVRIDPPLAQPIEIPDVVADSRPTSEQDATAFGFLKIKERGFGLKCARVKNTMSGRSDLGGRSESYWGTVIPGMSGGPVYTDGDHRLVGIAVLGDEELANCRIAEFQSIVEWLRQALGPHRNPVRHSVTADWVRVPASGHPGEMLVRCKPFLFSEVDDFVPGNSGNAPYPAPLNRVRSSTFAEISAGAIEPLLDAYSHTLQLGAKETLGLAYPAALNSICRDIGIKDASGLLKRRTNLAVHVEDAVTTSASRFALLPLDVPEWCLADQSAGGSASFAAFRPTRKSTGLIWELQETSAFGPRGDERAALRPAISLRYWADCPNV